MVDELRHLLRPQACDSRQRSAASSDEVTPLQGGKGGLLSLANRRPLRSSQGHLACPNNKGSEIIDETSLQAPSLRK